MICQSEKDGRREMGQQILTRHSSSCPLCPKAHLFVVCIEPRQCNSLLRQNEEDSKTSHASKEQLLQHRIWQDWEYFWLIFFCFLKPNSSFLLGLLLAAVGMPNVTVISRRQSITNPQFKKFSIELMNYRISFESCISIAFLWVYLKVLECFSLV